MGYGGNIFVLAKENEERIDFFRFRTFDHEQWQKFDSEKVHQLEFVLLKTLFSRDR